MIRYNFDIAMRPYYEPNANDIYQEPAFILEKKLYASKNYLAKHGTPKTVEDLKNHQLIGWSASYAKSVYYDRMGWLIDPEWLLKLGMPRGRMHSPFMKVNSIEEEIKAAKEGRGIIAAVKQMSILRESGLANILPNIKEETQYYFVCPNSLKDDPETVKIKEYLKAGVSKM